MVQYTRETLYEEVWKEPVSTVAKKYGVSDVAIQKICKSMDIPVPPRGYWAKKRAGQKVKQTPLPQTDKRSTITRYFSIDRKPPKPEPQLMEILSEDEYAASQCSDLPAGSTQKRILTGRSSMKHLRRVSPGTRSAPQTGTRSWKSRNEQHNTNSMCCSFLCSTVSVGGMMKRPSWCNGSCNRASRSGARGRENSGLITTWTSS